VNIIGIDPGASGGIVAIRDDGVLAWPMPETERDILDVLRTVAVDIQGRPARAVIEAVNPQPKNGAQGNFTFGRSYGGLRMALVAAGIPFESVSPVKWQRSFGLPTEKAAGSRTAKKNAHKARAQERFPTVKVTHAVADALLIAEWGRSLPLPSGGGA
jgi:hypothetical protein